MLATLLIVLMLASVLGLAGTLRTTAKQSWEITTVDSQNAVGRYASIALDGSGRPHIAYCDETKYMI